MKHEEALLFVGGSTGNVGGMRAGHETTIHHHDNGGNIIDDDNDPYHDDDKAYCYYFHIVSDNDDDDPYDHDGSDNRIVEAHHRNTTRVPVGTRITTQHE